MGTTNVKQYFIELEEMRSFTIANPETAISRCGVLLYRGLRFEDQMLVAELVRAHTITPCQQGVLNNRMTARDYRWGILFNQLLRYPDISYYGHI